MVGIKSAQPSQVMIYFKFIIIFLVFSWASYSQPYTIEDTYSTSQLKNQVIHADYNSILHLEKEIDSLTAEVKKKQLSNDEMMAVISNLLSTLSNENKTLAISGNFQQIKNLEERKIAEKIHTYLYQWTLLKNEIVTKMDILTQREMIFTIEGTYFSLSKILIELSQNSNLNLKVKIKLNEIYRSAEIEYIKYKENIDKYGLPKDGPLRTSPYRAFFEKAKLFVDTVSAENFSIEKTTFMKTLYKKTLRVYQLMKMLVRLSPTVISTVISIFSKDTPSYDKTPLWTKINSIFKIVKTEMGFKVNITGKGRSIIEKINNNNDPKTVYVIAPTHNHPILDNITMAELNIKDSLLVMATDQFIPLKSIANRLNDIDSLITVGRGSDLPIHKIYEQIEKGTSNNILIYPEGCVSVGLCESRPVRPKFSWGLIKGLVDKGYNVEIIPIVYKNNFKFLHENSVDYFLNLFDTAKSEKQLEVEILPSVDQEFLKSIMNANRPELLSLLLRSNWLEKYKTNDIYINGLIRQKEINRKISELLGVDLQQNHSMDNKTNYKCISFY